MSILHNITTITLVAAASLASTTSMAQQASGSAAASISNIHFELIDLNTNDGIDPSLSFFNPNTTAITSVHNYYGKHDGNDSSSYYWNAYNLTPVSTSSTTVSSGAFTSGDLSQSINSKAYQSGYGDFYAQFKSQANFSLSANTSLVITGNLSGFLNIEHASAQGSFADAAIGVIPLDFNSGAQASTVEHIWGPTNGQYSSENFSITFKNSSNATTDGWLHASALVTGTVDTNTPPVIPSVPEPESWAMMGLGLLGLGALARKRKQQQG